MFGTLSLIQEYRRRCERLDPLMSADVPSAVAAKYWLERSRMMVDTAEGAKPSVPLEAIRLYREIDDREGLYMALAYAAIGAHFPLAESAAMVEEMRALEQARWPFPLRHVRLVAEVVTLQRERHFAQACAVVQAELTQARAEGLDGWIAVDLNFLADMTLAAGDAVEAVRLAREGLAIDRRRRSQNILHTLATLTTALLALEAAGEARTTLAEFLAESRQREWDQLDAKAAGLCARLAALDGRLASAAKLLGFAGNMPRTAAEKFPNEANAFRQAWLAVTEGLPAQAVERLLGEGAALSREMVVELTLAESE